MGVSDSKYRVSRLKTRNRTRNRSRCSNQVRMALGIGLEVQDWSVSDSKSSLENGDSGNSELKVGLLAEGKNLPMDRLNNQASNRKQTGVNIHCNIYFDQVGWPIKKYHPLIDIVHNSNAL